MTTTRQSTLWANRKKNRTRTTTKSKEIINGLLIRFNQTFERAKWMKNDQKRCRNKSKKNKKVFRNKRNQSRWCRKLIFFIEFKKKLNLVYISDDDNVRSSCANQRQKADKGNTGNGADPEWVVPATWSSYCFSALMFSFNHFNKKI